MDEDGQILEQIHPGETVEEVLNYVEFPHAMLAEGMGRQLQAACESGLLSSREADSFLRFYRGGLKGYTYLDDNVTLQLSGILSTDQGIG